MPLDEIDYGSGQDSMQDAFDKINAAISHINNGGSGALITLNTDWSGSAAYRLFGSFVYLIGQVSHSAGAGLSLGTLPAGARPTTLRIFTTIYDAGSSFEPIRIAVNPDGTVVVTTALDAAIPDGSAFSLDPVCFNIND
jgi:hypothetical protein